MTRFSTTQDRRSLYNFFFYLKPFIVLEIQVVFLIFLYIILFTTQQRRLSTVDTIVLGEAGEHNYMLVNRGNAFVDKAEQQDDASMSGRASSISGHMLHRYKQH